MKKSWQTIEEDNFSVKTISFAPLAVIFVSTTVMYSLLLV